ncbi:hypothetical protein AB0L71_29175 [Streptomyces sp. NPDC052052]|uniref:hypothetical protein n=1 Tax=Streptomyces sp. NPDC052052 TaxID=3154756 RepID=UPI00341D1ECB
MNRRFRRNEHAHEREHRDDRAGNGMVNDGPENASQADAYADLGRGPGSGNDDGSEDLAELDEAALRRMLHGAVRDLEPGEGVLDHLHRAVPARRARRRQAIVGMAAAGLLIGTAVPALVHVAKSDGSNAASPAIAGHEEQAQGGSGAESDAGANGKSDGSTYGQDNSGRNQSDHTDSASDGGDQGADGDLAGGTADPASSAASVAACDARQLGVALAQTGAAGADGKVYGTFRISNVSDQTCSVSGSGTVGVQAMGAADPARITVVQHTAGDVAAGLPDPSQEQGTVLLKPSMSYEVRFAWVPKDACPASGSSPSPTPSGETEGSDGAASAGTGAADGSAGVSAQFGSEDGGTLDGSVAVTHTPEAGAPVAEAKIANACAGTVYRTGVLIPAK